MNKVILASQSPRRRELLGKMGVSFDVVPSNFDEKLDDTRDSTEVAEELALGKALDVAEKYPDSFVIGSDSIVTVDGKQLEKPRDSEDAERLIKLLSGKRHEVACAIAIVRKSDGIQYVGHDTSYLHFKPYDREKADAYLSTGDGMDKAGGYGIQSGAAPLIDHIEGHYDTIIGLPTHLLAEKLNQFGIDAKPVELEHSVKQVTQSANLS